MIAIYLPMIIVSSLFFGFEPALYCGISLLGFAFWRLGEDPRYKKLGVIIFIICTIIFQTAFIYFFITDNFFPENPFELKIPFVIANTIFGFKSVQIPPVSIHTLSSEKLDLAILFSIALIAYLLIQNLALLFSASK
jgi:hypothetical protein